MATILLILLCSLWLSCSEALQRYVFWRQDNMHLMDTKKLEDLSLELVYEAQLMQRQLLPIKLAYVNRMSYQVGLVIGTMREKYKRMMEIFIQDGRKVTGKIKLHGPGVWRFGALYFMIDLETIRRLEVEIHRYVDLLLKIPEKELNDIDNLRNDLATLEALGSLGGALRNGTNNKTTVLNPGALRTLSSTPNLQQFAGQNLSDQQVNKKQLLTEEDIKRSYREEYMKKNGLNDNSWSLDRHYGFI